MPDSISECKCRTGALRLSSVDLARDPMLVLEEGGIHAGFVTQSVELECWRLADCSTGAGR